MLLKNRYKWLFFGGIDFFYGIYIYQDHIKAKKKLSIDNSSASHWIDNFVENELIKKVKKGRKNEITFTEKGLKLIKIIEKIQSQ